MEEQKFSIILSYYTVSSRTSLGLHKNLSKKKGGGAEERKRERIREGADRQTDAEVILF